MCEDESVCEPFLLPTEILTVPSHGGGAPVELLIGVVIGGRSVLVV